MSKTMKKELQRNISETAPTVVPSPDKDKYIWK